MRPILSDELYGTQVTDQALIMSNPSNFDLATDRYVFTFQTLFMWRA